jgi:hypothetical protein
MTKEIVVRARPTLVTVGERAISTNGWRVPLVEEHLRWHLGQTPRKKWCGIGCMARTMFGRSMATTQAAVRRRIARAFLKLLESGLFLAIEYNTGAGSHGEIVAVKLFEPGSTIEAQFAERQLQRMKARREINEKVWEQALAILGIQHP